MPQSLYIGWWLPSDLASRLAIEGGEAPEDLHLTVAFVGMLDELRDDALDRVTAAVKTFSMANREFPICINGLALSPPKIDGRQCFHASVKSNELKWFREELCRVLCAVDLDPSTEYDFDPHITLKYLQAQESPPNVSVPYIETMLDSISVSVGSSETGWTRIDFPLTGPSYPLAMMYSEQYMEPPSTIPVLPRPGKYLHPTYGVLDLTEDRLDAFVSNFEKGVYQERLPVDLEHESKLSGAAGWIVGLVKNSDGSVDAEIEWTDMGQEALQNDRFGFVSPEWYPEWTSPITQEVFQNVLIGAALTTRPFFKPPALRALAASEMATQELMEANVSMTAEEQTRRFAELESSLAAANEKNAAMEAELAASKQAAQQYAEQSTQLAERVQMMERGARRQRFMQMVTGRTPGTDGAPAWFGETQAQVALLEHLADTAGEDSEIFKEHVKRQEALAEQMRSSRLFHEVGSGAERGSTDPQERIDQMTQKRASEKNISYRDALAQIAQEQPELYREAQASRRIKV